MLKQLTAGVVLGLAMVSLAVAQDDAASHTVPNQTLEGAPADMNKPMPLVERQDPITADPNLVPEDKLADPADHDYMPTPSTIPQNHLVTEPDRGAKLGETPMNDTLIQTRPNGQMPSTTKGPYYDASEAELRARKFFRGAGNVLLCPAEVPNQMFREAYRTSPITGVVVGAGKGLWMGAKRLMIGTWEMVTFFHPGKNNYQPYIQPEVVFEDTLH